MAGACRPIARGWQGEPVIEISGLYKIFGDDPAGALLLHRGKGLGRAELLEQHDSVLALKDVTLSMPARRIQVIMGLSGSGKSTLIRHINRLIEPTAGRVSVDGEDVLALSKALLRDFRRRRIAMVFQRFALLPHRTAAQNVAYGLVIQGRGSGEISRKTAYWLDRVGLDGQGDRFPGQLSGGMQQRVGLARALAVDPEIMLFDEPFSALDPLIRREMQDELLRLQSVVHKTMIFITHDFAEAIKMGDHIAIMKDGEFVQVGTPEEIVANPADDYVRKFSEDVPRHKVLTASSIMLNSDIRVSVDDTAGTAAANLNKSGSSIALVTDASGKYRGTIDAVTASGASSDAKVATLVAVGETVAPDVLVEDLIAKTTMTEAPIAVVDAGNVLLGSVDRKAILIAIEGKH